MRKIIVLSFVTLDGIMQAPGAPEEDTSGGFKYGGWVVPYFDEFLGTVMEGQMREPFELLLGRKTFEIFASYWPEHEADWPGINDAAKYVVSDTLEKHNWKNSIFIKGDVVKKIQDLKALEGPDLQVHGSGNLIQTLLRHDLVDELWLKTFPVTLGSGKRLFAEGAIPDNVKNLSHICPASGGISTPPKAPSPRGPQLRAAYSCTSGFPTPGRRYT